MTWAMRRRILYILAITIFFAVLVGGPVAYWYLTIQPTCSDGAQNQNESSPDHGGPCIPVDEFTLSPHAVMWARAFKVRDGTYDAVAYVENPNAYAGLARDNYRMKLYDSDNVLVAERDGMTVIMPGGITPVFEGGIDTGQRIATHAVFELDDIPVWQKMSSPAVGIVVSNKNIIDANISPRLDAVVENTTVADVQDLTFVAVIFDPAGNAFAASQTALDRLNAGEKHKIVFTWPEPFQITIGRIDIIPVHAPRVFTAAEAAAISGQRR